MASSRLRRRWALSASTAFAFSLRVRIGNGHDVSSAMTNSFRAASSVSQRTLLMFPYLLMVGVITPYSLLAEMHPSGTFWRHHVTHRQPQLCLVEVFFLCRSLAFSCSRRAPCIWCHPGHSSWCAAYIQAISHCYIRTSLLTLPYPCPYLPING